MPLVEIVGAAEDSEFESRSTTFEALRNAQYRLLWIGGLLSFLAVQMQFIARGWLAYDITGTNSGLGGVYLGFGVPMLLMIPWGGVAADRLSKRRVLLVSQCSLALSAGVLGVAIVFDAVEYWMLIAASVVQGAAFSFVGPTRMAFTGELVGRAILPNAIVLQQMSMNGTRVFGPAVAGVLIGVATVGVGGVYFLTCALICAAAVTTFFLPPGLRAASHAADTPLGELRDGIRYVRRQPVLLLLIATSFVIVMVAFPYVAFLPTLADEIFSQGASGYGLLSGASAIGALGASLAIASRAGGRVAWRLQAIAGVLFGAGIAALAWAPNFLSALGLILLAGGAGSAFQSLNNSLALSSTDFDYHGRVQSLMMLSFSGFGMAALPLGAVADAIGLPPTMLIMGGITVLAMGVYLAIRRRLPDLAPLAV